MSTNINSVSNGVVWYQTGYGIPDHIAIKGTTYLDLNTVTEYLNEDGVAYWKLSGGGGPSTDIYISGMTFNTSNYDLNLFRNDGITFTQNLGILSSDMNVTGGTYNQSTGTATFTNNSGGTFQVTGFLTGITDTYVTGGTYSNGTTTFTNNSGGTFSISGFSTGSTQGISLLGTWQYNPMITTPTYAQVTTNNTSPTGATELNFYNIDRKGQYFDGAFKLIKKGSKIACQSTTSQDAWIIYNVTSDSVDLGDYTRFGVSMLDSGSSGSAGWIDVSSIFISSYVAPTDMVTGTGSNGQVAFWNGTNSQTSSSGFTWDGNKVSTTKSTKATPIAFNINHYTHDASVDVSFFGGNYFNNSGSLGRNNTGFTAWRFQGNSSNNNIYGGVAMTMANTAGVDNTIYNVAMNAAGNGFVTTYPNQRFIINSDTDNGIDQLQVNGSILGTTIKKLGGLSTQFLKADGSLDSNSYLVAADISGKENKSEKGQPNGYAPLDSNQKVPLVNINDALIGNVNYQGLWDQTTNTPNLTTVQPKGYYYICSGLTQATVFGLVFNTGDWIISDGTNWTKVDNTDSVSSVFGRTGNISAVAGDYTTALVTETTNKRYQTDNQNSFNDATSSIQTQLNGKQSTLTNPITGIGTTNYISKFTGSGTLGNSMIFDNGTQIGIGGGNPTFGKLELGNTTFGTQTFAFFTADGTVNSRALIEHITTSNSQRVNFTSAFSTASDYANWTFETGDVGIGTTTPLSKLNVTNLYYSGTPTKANSAVFLDNQGTGVYLGGNEYGYGYIQSEQSDITLTKNLVLQPNGSNVGVGALNPVKLFEIGGEGRANTSFSIGRDNIVGDKFIFIKSTTDGSTPYINSYLAGTGVTNLAINPDGGNVGIGTVSPQARLDTESGIQTNTPDVASAGAYLKGVDVGVAFGQFSIENNYSSWMQSIRRSDNQFFNLSINPNGGNVGIGSSKPLSKLNIQSDVNFLYPTLGQISGSLFLAGDNNLYGLIAGTHSGNGNAWLQVQRVDGTPDPYNLLLQPIAGLVGIGTTIPERRLDVNGSIRGNTIEAVQSVDFSNNDLNTLTSVGWFKGVNNTNAPNDNDQWWYIMVESHGNGWFKQTATSYGGGANPIAGGTTFIRVFTDNTSWSAWRQLAFV